MVGVPSRELYAISLRWSVGGAKRRGTLVPAPFVNFRPAFFSLRSSWNGFSPSRVPAPRPITARDRSGRSEELVLQEKKLSSKPPEEWDQIGRENDPSF
jgi:hypothetical protein